jgi:hypothetical protein
MRLEVKNPCFLHLSELAPCHGIGCVRYGRRVDEKGDGNMVSPDERKHVGIDRNVAVINGDDDRMGRGSPSISKIIVDEFSEGDHLIAIVPEIFQMGLEKGCGHGHAIASCRPKAVIQENGDMEGSQGWQQP